MGEPCPSSGPDSTPISWSFRLKGRRADWDWSAGPPDVRHLQSYRRPASGSASRHVPVRAFSYTTGGYLALESGLEHDLLRLLDRDPSVTWLVSQPFALGWDVAGRRTRKSHVPDLISVVNDGAVTVWDVKSPEGAASSKFADVREVSRQACEERNWGYEVFTGLGPTHRHNLLWLHAYRRRQPWVDAYEDDLIAACNGGAKLGDLVRDRRSDEFLAALWHLIWAGRLKVDLAQRLTGANEVTA